MDREAIRLEHITKIYKLYNRNRDRLKDALGLTRKKCYSEHYALKDVSMTIRQGNRGNHRSQRFRKIYDFKDYHRCPGNYGRKDEDRRTDLGPFRAGSRI